MVVFGNKNRLDVSSFLSEIQDEAFSKADRNGEIIVTYTLSTRVKVGDIRMKKVSTTIMEPVYVDVSGWKEMEEKLLYLIRKRKELSYTPMYLDSVEVE